MKTKLLIDTDIIIDFLRGFDIAVRYIKSHSEEIVLSVITVAELYAGVKGNDEHKELDDFIDLFPILQITTEVARNGGLYKREYFKSHGVGLADGLIAASAEFHDAVLKTLNIKHYPMIKGLKPPYFKK
ncbi:MAG: type II toxin-antitoxin system VapC family toxin [Deltaproteobacteria bacterium]|nr:type II toxin-antitoxin system VapC family toxin [Deltaproteobacteria bacterium]